MKFKYSARTKEGELQTGFVESADYNTAVNTLTGHGLFVLGLESQEEASFFGRLKAFGEKVRGKDLMVFTRQFATLLEAEISFNDALKALYRQTKQPVLKEAVADINKDIDSGMSLSQAFGRHSAIFSDFYVNIMRASELTGHVQEAMSYLADYLEREVNLKIRVRNALIYPAIVIGLFIIVAVVLVGYVLPQIQPIFEESKVELPFFTKILFGLVDLLIGWWWLAIIAILLLVFLFIDYFKTKEGKLVYNELTVKIPVVGGLFRKMYVARFSDAMTALIKGGIPIVQSIDIAGNTIDNVVYKDILNDVAQSVRGGETISQALARHEDYLPPLVGQMVAVGESTGRLEIMFTRIAKFYAQEVENLVDNLVELIQPMLMIFIGVFVGLLFASILLPIYTLVQTF